LGRSTNNGGTGFGTILLRVVFAAMLCLGVWYGFAIQRDKPNATPQLASLDGLIGTNLVSQVPEPEPETTNQMVAPPALVPTNSVVAQTNRTSPDLDSSQRQLRSVQNTLDAQIALARKGISVGTIDGVPGENMKRALLAYQIHHNLSVSGDLDEETKKALTVEEPLYIQYMVSEDDLNRLVPVPSTWLGKSEAARLDYETILELVAEKGRSSQTFIRKINPQINWTNITAGTLVKIPRIDPPRPARAAFARVHLYSKTINVFGKSTNLIAHFPCSIAANKEKRPVGQLFVEKAALNPTYLFSPEVFSESAEAKKIGRKLNIPAGPNNPVGTAWIGLSRPGYGIHGTPKPEQIGRTESHGCFRLANWNAEHLLQMSWAGMPVYIEP
jgi:peptidoglycan hydrolase-like protein with peptidoglycan-binding domain